MFTSVLRNGELVTTKTLIDNIFLNTQNNFNPGTLEVTISNHYPVFTTLYDCKLSNSNDEKIKHYRLINEATLRKFKYALMNNDELSNILDVSMPQTLFSNFLAIFNKLYNHYFPIKQQKLTRKGIYKP